MGAAGTAIVVRDTEQLSATGRLVLDHLRAAEAEERADIVAPRNCVADSRLHSRKANTALANQQLDAPPGLRQIGGPIGGSAPGPAGPGRVRSAGKAGVGG